jgi:hypothetical protein
MWNLKLYPYKIGSESATKLAELLDIMRVRPDGTYVPKREHRVVNWGNGKLPNWSSVATQRNVTILNKPAAVNIASNKLSALQALKTANIRIPEFTTNYRDAQRWLDLGDVVVERHELRGNSGDGIRIVTYNDDEMEQDLETAPLYTKFINKTAEFRVHVFRGEVIDYIEKKRMSADRRPFNYNKYVSSITCGWVFTHTNVRDIPEVRQLAIKAVASLGLDFGAVDIVYADGIPYVLEVNTAPGLSGVTLVKYANAFRHFMGMPDLDSSVTAPIIGTSTFVTQPVRPSTVAGTPNQMTEFIDVRITRADAARLSNLLTQALR